jgi:uncharacterized protein YqeY
MNLQERINNDMKEAMKAKDSVRLAAIRMLKAAFIQNNTAVKPTDDLSVAISHVKKLQDSLAMFPEGSQQRLETQAEIDALKVYLPQEMTEAEVKTLIDRIKAAGAKDMGAVMKELQPQIKGRFDGKKASDMVKAALT